MEISQFKLIRNKQRPDFCYNYQFVVGDDKYEIFTMNGGRTFYASKETKRLDGRYYKEIGEEVSSINEALTILSK